MAKTVVVGMSGGVDSSVAAYLLKEEGFNVVGLFMHNWEERDASGHCGAESDFEDVKSVAGRIGIPYYSVNFAAEYQERVFSYFLEEYKAGRTPNPDVLCNREIKFGPFIDYAKRLGADYVATGHYCGVRHGAGGAYLLKAADEGKDQTYFLNQVTGGQLEHVMFPLAGIGKPEVREVAKRLNLSTAGKKDSTGICFIGERKFKAFLSEYLPARPGEIRSSAGQLLGRHDGLMYYTLGQRRGLNIGGVKGEAEGRWFVYKKDLDNNILYVENGDESLLMSESLETGPMNFIPSKERALEILNPTETAEGQRFTARAKFRYRQPEQDVTAVLKPDGSLHIDFAVPQRAITPGQYAALYKDEYCLGGAVIL